MVLAVLKSMRPHQWVKNAFVLAPLVFAQQLMTGPAVWRAALATALFCLVSGAVYLVNDCFDVEKDRQHPTKRDRPIPSGALGVPAAQMIAAGLALGSLAVGALLSPAFAGAMLAYLVVNAAYSRALKHKPYVDVLTIAFGFLVRIVAGALAIDVPVSVWLFACTFLLALYLGMGKRRHELLAAGGDASRQRKVLDAYDPTQLTMAMLGTALATTAAYTAYAVEDHTTDFGTNLLPLTIPFCVVGLTRFFRLSSASDDPHSPTERMVTDLPFLANLLAWGALVVYLIYAP